jgi:hypothetical protein
MRKIGMGLLVCVCLFCARAVLADDKAHVPQTGQTTSYDTNTPQRDDGALQEGVELPIPRFTDRGNGTIKDNLTGLIWLKQANCAGIGRTWQQALDDVASLNATGRMNGNICGDTSRKGTHQRDWRLPNIEELLSLVHYGFWQPALSNAAGTAQAQCSPVVDCPFSNFFTVVPGPYWSSTTRFIEPGSAWRVDFIEGNSQPPSKNQELGVLAVRGGS